jgi:lysophospholipase L1-like esterase
MVINLGANDEAPGLRKGLTGFLEINRDAGTRTLLIEEPVIRGVSERFEDKYAVIRELGSAYRAPVLPLVEYLQDPKIETSGFLWWDWVHQTPYGQQVVAEWLEPFLLKQLRNL